MKLKMLIRGAVLGATTVLFNVATAYAAGTGTGTTPSQSASPATGENTPLNLGGATSASHSSGGGSSIVRTVVGLFIVIAVIYGISWILRQAKKGKQGRASGAGLASVANLPLGSGRSVALVRAGRELILLGVAEQGVTPIRSYTEAEALEAGFDRPGDDDSDDDGLGGGSTGRGFRGSRGSRGSRDAGSSGALVDRIRQLTVRS